MTNWSKKKLGDISKINYGYTTKASFEKTDSYFLRITDIKDNKVDWETVPYCSVIESEYEKYKLINDDIVFARTGATTGKSYLVKNPPKSVAASYLIRLRLTDDNVLAEFIAKYFQTFEYWNKINLGISGSAQGGFNASKLSNLVVPIPPLEEQKRIVKILDEVFKGIAIAEANTKKNLANAIELFDSYLNQVFTEKSDRWTGGELEKVIGSVSTGPFGSLLHKSDYIENGIPLVNPANIDGSKIIPNIKKTVSPETLGRLNNYILFKNDIVVGRRGEIGRCAVIGKSQEGWLCGTGCFFIRPQENIDSIFIAHLLRSDKYRGKLELLATGATMKNLSNSALARLIVALPSFAEQQKIVNLLSELQEKTEELESIYQRKLEALAELKQSILQKAFTGQLT